MWTGGGPDRYGLLRDAYLHSISVRVLTEEDAVDV